MLFRALLPAVVITVGPSMLWAQAQGGHEHHAPGVIDPGHQIATVSGLRIPDVELVNQHGEKVHFYSDLVKGKVVVINTIFTTCTTICPMLGANFAQLNKLLSTEDRSALNLISISVDPSVDTPARLSEWSSKFGEVGPGWTLLTGSKNNVDELLKALQVFTADKESHKPVTLIGGNGIGNWARADGLLAPSVLAGMVRERLTSRAALQYFTDIELTTQAGDSVRFYSDLLKDKFVVASTFFGTCTGACPMMAAILSGVQERLGDRLGKEVYFVSFSVDPGNDTPAKLKEYAQRFDAKPGWLFVTGKPENVDFALARLGHKGPRDQHQTVFMILNNGEGLAKVGFDTRVTADSLTRIIESGLQKVRDQANGGN
jgi:protein SCO1